MHQLAQLALDFEELDVVLQALGRGRPFTRPREVITLQCGQLPGVRYTKEFNTLAEARSYFRVRPQRERKKDELARRIAETRAAGLTQVETAARIGVSVRTVRAYEKREDRQVRLI